MNSTIQIPQLSRNAGHYCDFVKTDIPSGQLEAIDLFDMYPVQEKSSVNPLADISGNTKIVEEYFVDDEPLPESSDGCLKLKMPILILKEPEEESFDYDVNVNIKNDKNNSNKKQKTPRPLVSIYDLATTHVLIPLQITIHRVFQLIRDITLSTDELQESVIKKTRDSSESPYLYKVPLVYTCFDKYDNHRFAKMELYIREVSLHPGPLDEKTTFDSFAIEVIHIQGDSRISMEYFNTMQYYILENGYTNCRVRVPDFTYGFSDMYECAMESEPNTFK